MVDAPTYDSVKARAFVEQAKAVIDQGECSPEDAGTTFLDLVVGYPAAFILLRWLDDVGREEEAIAAFEGRPYTPLLPDGLAWRELPRTQNPNDFFGHLWHSISSAQPVPAGEPGTARHVAEYLIGRLEGPFDTVDEPGEVVIPPFEQKLVLMALRWVDGFDDLEELRTAFDDLIRLGVENAPYGGEHYTPQPIVDLMVALADPQPGEFILDPGFRTGGLLTAAARHIIKQAGWDNPAQQHHRDLLQIHGVESGGNYLVGVARSALAGVIFAHPLEACGIHGPISLGNHDAFDCILAHLPSGGQLISFPTGWLDTYPIQSRSIVDHRIQQILTSLRPGGRAIMVVPDYFLFRGGAEAEVRKWILQEFRVDAVLALPDSAFEPYTTVKQSLLCISRNAPARDVWFVQPKGTEPALREGVNSETHCKLLSGLLRMRRGDSMYEPSMQATLGLLRSAESNSKKEPNEIARLIISAEAPEAGLYEAFPSDYRPSQSAGFSVSIQQLAQRNFELLPKATGEELIDGLINLLEGRYGDTVVAALNEVATVMRGRRYPADARWEGPSDRTWDAFVAEHEGRQPTAYLRVRDLADGGVDAFSSFLRPEFAAEVADADRLVQGDVLLSVDGTIGRVALVDEFAAGNVAGQGIIVLRPKEHVRPRYLLRLLQSTPYQEWFAGHATGAAVQHLRVSALRRLRVPVPSEEVQQHIAMSAPDDTDLVAYLTEGLDPLAFFLESDQGIKLLEEARSSSFAGSALIRELERLTRKTNNDHLKYWADVVVQIAKGLTQAKTLALGAERLALLETMRAKYDSALFAFDGLTSYLEHLTGQDWGASEYDRALAAEIEREREKIRSAVRLRSQLEPAVIPLEGEHATLQLRVTNEGVLSLYNIRLKASTFHAPDTLKLLEPGSSSTLSLQVPTPYASIFGEVGNIVGHLFDGTDFQQSVHLNYRVQSLRTADLQPLEGSPYITGSPIQERPEMFKGREDVLQKIRLSLSLEGPSTVIIMVGNRRLGKSSILHRLSHPGVLPDAWLTAYWSFQDASSTAGKDGVATEEIFYNLARVLVLAVLRSGHRLHVGGVGELVHGDVVTVENGREMVRGEVLEPIRAHYQSGQVYRRFEAQVEAALAAVYPKRMLLLVDELDMLQHGIATGITSRMVPENLRALLHKHPGLSCILCGSPRIRNLYEDYYGPLFGMGPTIKVEALDRQAAERLVTEPVEGALVYAPAARDRVVDLCARQPYLIQSLSEEIYNHCAIKDLRTVTTEVVNEAAEEFVAESGHFRDLWKEIGTARRRYLTWLIETLQDGPDRITFDLLDERMGAARLQRKGLARDLEALRDLDIISYDEPGSEGAYRLVVPLFGRWIRQKDGSAELAEARDEQGF